MRDNNGRFLKDVRRGPLPKKIKIKISKSLMGHSVSLKARKKIRLKALEQFKNGMPEETRKKISKSHCGEKSYLWKGGLTLENEKIRKNIEYRLWRESVFARDNWTCRKCGKRGNRLHAHHIKNFAQWQELRFAIDNGITFCKDCHKDFHHVYGTKNNIKEQIIEFLNIKI